MSNYDVDSLLLIGKNKKIIGLLKDELIYFKYLHIVYKDILWVMAKSYFKSQVFIEQV